MTRIVDELDSTLKRMVDEGLCPAAIYLTPEDYEALAAAETEWWQQESGSTALCWPISHADVPLISKHLVDKLTVPVRKRINCVSLKSTVYASTGRGIPVASYD